MKRHYMPVTADVPGVSEGQRALIRKVIRTALAAEEVDFPCEVDVRVTNDDTIHQINREMRQVDRATDVLSFPMFDLTPGSCRTGDGRGPRYRAGASGRHGDLLGACGSPGQGVWTLQSPGAGIFGGHSVLHLLGYDHLDEGVEKARMRAREEAILAELGITR